MVFTRLSRLSGGERAYCFLYYFYLFRAGHNEDLGMEINMHVRKILEFGAKIHGLVPPFAFKKCLISPWTSYACTQYSMCGNNWVQSQTT